MRTNRELTFQHNRERGRHGWLRLTPAYSVALVAQILRDQPAVRYLLDPFSGTGTTGLVAAENAIPCDLIDINPFLVWFAQTKTANYKPSDLRLALSTADDILARVEHVTYRANLWRPPIHNIERWWTEDRLRLLAALYQEITLHYPDVEPARDLSLIAFCQLVIEASNAAFNHQSMSFKDVATRQLELNLADEPLLITRFRVLLQDIVNAAEAPIQEQTRVIQGDARSIPSPQHDLYDCVITSPPYPNRMSYIRELRPYMYWLGYLHEAREAGELDWQAIGGTWGIATSRLQAWQPDGVRIDDTDFQATIARIADHSPLLANYVHKYFVDVTAHLSSVYLTLARGAKVYYIVGNSKFYDTVVPVEQFYARLLESVGFESARVAVLRKRNSKKELFEYVVTAQKP